MPRRPALLFVLAITLGACAPAAAPSSAPAATLAPAPSAAPSSAPSPSPSASASPRPTATPRPSPPPGTVAWPKVFDVAMTGTYWSNPPFRIPFSITVAEPGWFSGHLHAEFIDIQRFDGITPHQFPNRMLGFGDPEHIRGPEGDVDVTGLDPASALAQIADRASLTSANPAAVQLFGIEGARLDLHSATNNNPLFGGSGGNFGLGPELDIRLVLLPFAGRLLVVAVMAAPGDLDGAWEQALPILETVDLAD